jgi:alanine dehydrogenase
MKTLPPHHYRSASSRPARSVDAAAHLHQGGLELLQPDGELALPPRDVGLLVREALQAVGDGVAYGQKVVLQPKDDELLQLVPASELADRFAGERLNWKLSALVGLNDRYGAVKIVGSNAYNRVLGLPRSRSTILLFDKLTMRPIFIVDGTEISAARTGAYASIVLSFILGERSAASVFLFGAGKVAEKVVLDLQAHHAARVRTLYVMSRTPDSARRFAESLGARVSFPVVASEGAELGAAEYVITASNAREPLFAADALADGAVVLHLGGDETPAGFIRRALERGSVFCDDVHSVSHRNSQSLALYFSRAGRRLEDEAARYQVLNLWDALRQPRSLHRLPALVTCVGLPVLDLYLVQRVFELARGRSEARAASTAPHALS